MLNIGIDLEEQRSVKFTIETFIMIVKTNQHKQMKTNIINAKIAESIYSSFMLKALNQFRIFDNLWCRD